MLRATYQDAVVIEVAKLCPSFPACKLPFCNLPHRTPPFERNVDLSWYAVYTCAGRDKRVKQQMDLRRIRCALPLYRTVRHWKDCRKELVLPLFPSYIFVNLALGNRVRVLEIPGVVSFVVGKGGRWPCPTMRSVLS